MRPSVPLVFAFAAGLLACGPASSPSNQNGDGGSQPPPAIEVAGTWDDNFGGTTAITQSTWGTSKIVAFDDAGRYAILQSPADDPSTPNEFAKYVWTKPDQTGFWYCTVDFGLATADLAKNTTKTADASDPANSGCGAFAWTHMTPHFALEGDWDDNYGYSTTITATKWGTSTVVSHDDASMYAVLQSPPDDQFTPNEFAKYVWTKPDAGGFWFCIVDFGKASADEAKNTTKTADATHPESGGCGGFPWTRMMPKFVLDGTWDDNYGSPPLTISSIAWGTSTVVSYDDDARFAIVQSPADDQYTPNEFAKYVWTKPDETGWWWCIVDYGEASADAAKTTTKSADDSDPANGGCGGFPWTHMTKHQG